MVVLQSQLDEESKLQHYEVELKGTDPGKITNETWEVSSQPNITKATEQAKMPDRVKCLRYVYENS